ncbi:MAG: TetR/AcrR family transcriptional regulator [Clostridiales bacterium]|nr:TetR/AcrR family transcriptional regulator [Clostridiales bacterium]
MAETRIPTQKRSIEKRNKIIEKGFELICEKGFHNTNTNEIANYAGVSTGIIYQYFNDKKEIFIEGVKNYSASIMYPMLNLLENNNIDINNFSDIIESIIDSNIKSHNISKKAHEELMAMSHLDEDVANAFNYYEMEITDKIVSVLENNNIRLENAKEKIHIMVALIENLCHEIIYHNHNEINYDIMKKETINIIINFLDNSK